MNLGQRCYVGGEVSYFDHCNADMMSMREVIEMATELCYEDIDNLRFQVSLGQPNDCIVIEELVRDIDTMNMENFVDDNRVVGVYIEVVKPTAISDDNDDGSADIVEKYEDGEDSDVAN